MQNSYTFDIYIIFFILLYIYLLTFFSKIFLYTDHAFNFLQSKTFSNIKSCISKTQNLKQNLADFRKNLNVDNFYDETIILINNLEYDNKKRNELRKIIYEILYSLIVEIDLRSEDFPKLEFVGITNEQRVESVIVKFA